MRAMSYATEEARQLMLETVAEATDEIAVALAAAGAAYEQLDDASADRLEEELFRPLQVAYGRAQRTHASFAERSGLPGRSFTPPSAGLPSQGIGGFLERAGQGAEEADAILADLQDSLRPVEVGDAELRAGLADVRGLLGDLPGRLEAFVRVLGR